MALVTGASSGIGLEFCRTLAAHGCRLIMVSNEADKLMECATLISKQTGVEAVALYSDLTQPDATGKILDFLDSKGLEPDILINNAGIFSFKPVVDTPVAKIGAFIDLHVRAVTELCRAFAQRMASRGTGNILNMSSMSCWMPMPGLAMYASTKAYIRVFSRSLHYEMRDSGVRVTVACPGGIATDLFGLPENLMKLAVNIGAVQTPEKFTERALRAMLKGKKQYINGLLNRISIVFVGILPTSVRMLIKHKMLDKNITR
ncbi:MAG: SDR family NAD(P)-dependent oxidoreductase [Muribaculaceae bacterium]|nr:SDR family NAD(P)-dependent oxidoreductase [Muribaculaceae bacterium]